MSKHTPGPWHISGAAEGQGYSISAKTGLIAFVRDDTHPLAAVTEGQAQSNARLIAAAPELLEACKRVSDEIGSADYYGGISLACVNQLVAAITKAEHQS